ncbi:hypothetical protein [Porphyrobacter sp. AAP60]|uniref:hypothetical protein n=1 Tax=Porphyrobacter sp. AAP60 TaxID=1523423 RepID=UPI0006B8CB14|nr:hypothetical protein [Porphyrobacter sp. AAP60]KPF65213.1 hypothetical protein IP79_03315 [Porphyrobacter sp. AAP60]
MNPDLLLPIVSSAAWLILAASALASFRLGWGQMIKMALLWIAIFGGIFLAVEWFFIAQGSAATLV